MTERIPLYGEQTEAAARLARVFEATGCRTQMELAKVLGIRQSSISDAKKRNAIPADWLLTLIRDYNINPEWVIQGVGPKYLYKAEDANGLLAFSNGWLESNPLDSAVLLSMLCCIPCSYLEDEIRRRRHLAEKKQAGWKQTKSKRSETSR